MKNGNFDQDYYIYHIHRLIAVRDAYSPDLNFLCKMFGLVTDGKELYNNQRKAVDRYIQAEPDDEDMDDL